jgi:hypothetical protein
MAFIILLILFIPETVYADPVSALITATASTIVAAFGSEVTAAILAKTFIVSAATTLLVTGAAKALAPKPRKQSAATVLPNSGQTFMVRDSIASRKIIYGTTRVSGVITYAQTIADELHIILAIATHEVESYNQFYFNDESLGIDGNGWVQTPTKYANKARILYRTGADDQSVMQELVDATAANAEVSSEGLWTQDHKMSGIAYLYIVLISDTTAYANGIPNISVNVSGKKLYDTRSATTSYSANPALVLYDYLTNTRYGLGIDSSEIDTAAFNTAANSCDETVSKSDGSTESRYESNGTIDTSSSYANNIEAILSSMYGTFFYSGGVFSVKAGVYQVPTVTLTENDFISELAIQTRQSKRDSANGIKGTFNPIETNYITTDYPSVISETFINEDDGDENIMDYPLPLTTSPTMAQRIARIALYRGREQMTISMKCNLQNAFNLQIGDSVMVTKQNLGFSSKVFQVAQWSFNIDNSGLFVDLTLREISSSVYDYELADEKVFITNNTSLFVPDVLTAPGLSVTEELRDYNEQVITAIIITLSTSRYFIDRYEVEIKRNVDTNWINIGNSSSQIYEYLNAEDSTIYNIRARAIGSFNQKSDYSTANITIVGKTAPPSNVTDLSVNIIGDSAVLTWTPVPDLDLSHYTIRHSSLTSGATYSGSRTIVDKVSRPGNQVIVPALTGTYFIKAIDKLGLESLLSTSTIAVINKIENTAGGYETVITATENPTFSGTLDDTAIVDSMIVLDTTTLFDDTSGNFDDALGSFDGGGGYVDNEGFYYFSNNIDLTYKYTIRLSQIIEIERLDYVNLFDDASGNFDDREGNFDGDSIESGATDAVLQLSITNDDPASGGATWTSYSDFVKGDYTGRGFRFRVILTSSDEAASPGIDILSVIGQMPYNYTSGQDISSGTSAGGYTVTYPTPFYQTKGVAITAQNLSSGDYWEIVSKSGSNFVIRFKNSGGTVVSRTFDYTAVGLGQRVA